MIAHRAFRDVQRCRTKYGEAWLEYERQVPYLFIPVSPVLALSRSERLIPCSTSSRLALVQMIFRLPLYKFYRHRFLCLLVRSKAF